MTYLRSARGRLLGLQSSNGTQTPTVGGVLAADNPFVGVSRTPGGDAYCFHLRAIYAVAGFSGIDG